MLPETEDPDINVYDMRLVKHEDGWIYGLFCTERKDPAAPRGDLSSAAPVWDCADADLKTGNGWTICGPVPQQRNVVLHPEFWRASMPFIHVRRTVLSIPAQAGASAGGGGRYRARGDRAGADRARPQVSHHLRGQERSGAGPYQDAAGWLHLAHGVRNTAAGLRYVIYVFMTALDDPACLIHEPGGYLIAPGGEERVGDVSNVTFSNGWVAGPTVSC